MAAVLTRSQSGQAGSRLSAAFQREVGPDLAALEGQRRRYRLGYAVAVAAMLAGIFLAFLWIRDLNSALFAGGLAVVIGFLAMQAVQRGYSVQMRKAVMPAICDAIGDISHGTGEATELDFDSLAQLGLLPSHNRRRIDDVFRGRHRATGFAMAEVRLRRTGGGRRRSSRTVFRGLVMAIDVPRPIPARILIAKDAGHIANSLKGWIKSFGEMQRVPLTDQAFEARFEVYADRADVTRTTMTPELCANLVALAASHEGAGLQAAFANDRFFVTLPKRGDLFRIGSLFRSTDALECDAASVMEDVLIVHRLIDYLHGDRPQPAPDVTQAARQQDHETGPIVRR